ncbi:MAG: hypothetical protein ABIT76_08620 [Chthoniobacterales bacterium]
MSAPIDLQTAVLAILSASLSTAVPVLEVKPKDLVSRLEMAAQDFGVAIHSLPPLPTHFLQGNPFVFFDKAEIRVRVTEWPDMNTKFPDGYELCDEVAMALHWQPFNKLNAAVQELMTGGMEIDAANAAARANVGLAPWWALSDLLAHPLQLASRPIEMVEDKEKRIFDVIFEAQYQINPT